MSHVLSRPLKQALWVGQLRPLKKADIDVGCKSINVSKCGTIDTGSGLTIMECLSDVFTAVSYCSEPK